VQGQTDEKGLATTWSAKGENVVWKAPLPKCNNGFSSPIVSGGRVFLTYAINAPLEHHVMSLNAADGAVLWDVKVEPGPWRLTDLRGGYGAPTPCADGKRVYVVFGSAVVAALDFDGKPAWRYELPRFAFDVAMGSSPILHKDAVVYLCDQTQKKSSLLALEAATGKVRWDELRPGADFAHTTPVPVEIGGKPQLLIGAAKDLQGVDPENGKVLWSARGAGDVASPVYDGKVVYVDSGRGGPGMAVDPTGTGEVSKTHVKWRTKPLGEGLGSPIVAGEHIYRLQGPGVLKCFNPATGEEVFSERLEKVHNWASPIATADGLVYYASGGTSYVLRAGPKLEVVAKNELEDQGGGSPAVAGGRIYVRGTKYLYCIGKK